MNFFVVTFYVIKHCFNYRVIRFTKSECTFISSMASSLDVKTRINIDGLLVPLPLLGSLLCRVK